MQFDETHKVIPETLTVEEAKSYILFLSEEIIRHEIETDIAEDRGRDRPALKPFYNSAVLRHKDDIRKSYEVIVKVKKRFKL